MLNPDLLGPALQPILSTFTDTLRRDLAPGIANEQLTGVPIATITGDLLSYLNRASPPVPPSAARK